MPVLRRHLVAVAGAALVLTAVTPAGPGVAAAPVSSPAPAAAPGPGDPPTPTIPKRYLNQTIDWEVCDFDAQVHDLYPDAPTTNCATVKAPMDWQHPNAHRDIDLAIAYSEATGEQSQGLMTTNPGGPGGAGLTLSASLAIDEPRLFEQYDLLGFDPRGFGDSEPLRCLTTPQQLESLPTTADYRERDRRTHRTEIAEAELLSDACSARPYGQFVGSQQTVYDMDFLRALMAAPQLNFIGYSYGTWLGSWYADTYPRRVGRFVLDSNMDWTHTQWQNVNFDPFSFQRRRDTMLLPWIARHAGQIKGLGNTRAKVLATYEGVRAGVVALYKSHEGNLRGDGLDGTIASAIYSNSRFGLATLAILEYDEFVQDPSPSGDIEQYHVNRALRRIDPSLVSGRVGQLDSYRAAGPSSLFDRARRLAEQRPADAKIDLGAVGDTVRCNDTAWRSDPSFYTAIADRQTAKNPFFGYLNGVSMCAFWPYEPQDRNVDLTGAPEMLMVEGEIDPATAYEGAMRSHDATGKHTVFVSIDDEGQHGQYIGSASSCVDRTGNRFVFTGELPGRDRICGTSPLPGDSVVFPVNGPVDGNSVPLPGDRHSRQHVDPRNPMLQAIFDRIAATTLFY